jgi:GMP synthase-like glutamine amidotransferase
LPAEAVLLVESDPCRNQAFRIGTSSYGLQFHVEVTEEMIDLWMEDEGAAERARIASEGALVRDLFVRQGALILRNFRRIVESTYRMKKVMEVFVEKVEKPNKELWWNIETHSLIAAG